MAWLVSFAYSWRATAGASRAVTLRDLLLSLRRRFIRRFFQVHVELVLPPHALLSAAELAFVLFGSKHLQVFFASSTTCTQCCRLASCPPPGRHHYCKVGSLMHGQPGTSQQPRTSPKHANVLLVVSLHPCLLREALLCQLDFVDTAPFRLWFVIGADHNHVTVKSLFYLPEGCWGF